MSFEIDEIKQAIEKLEDRNLPEEFSLPIKILKDLLKEEEKELVDSWKKIYQYDKTKVIGLDKNGQIKDSLSWKKFMEKTNKTSFIGKFLLCFQVNESEKELKVLIEPIKNQYNEVMIIEELRDNKDINRYIDIIISIIRYVNLKHVYLLNCSYSLFELLKKILKDYDKRYNMKWLNNA
jgi:hypothetical protein